MPEVLKGFISAIEEVYSCTTAASLTQRKECTARRRWEAEYRCLEGIRRDEHLGRHRERLGAGGTCPRRSYESLAVCPRDGWAETHSDRYRVPRHAIDLAE